MKVIYDTDPGIDDAMALLYLHACPEIELIGICTVAGNADIDTCTRNALILCERFGIDVPVYRGAGTTMDGTTPVDFPHFVHGRDGLGNTNLPAPSGSASETAAEDYLVEAVDEHSGEITILAVGRMTNLANALQKDKNFADRVQRVVMMGGALETPGNVTPFAEANIYGDPEAAEALFKSAAPVTMVGLDVTNQTRMSLDFLRALFPAGDALSEFILNMNMFYANFYLDAEGADNFPVHDSSAVAYLDRPELFQTETGFLTCTTEGDGRGRTLLTRDDAGKDRVCLGVNSEALVETYRNRVSNWLS